MIYSYIIYKLLFPNGKVYIGQTCQDFNDRMNDYKNLNSIGRFVKNAVKCYGWNNIKKEIICTVLKEFVNETEKYFIKKYNSNNKLFGYNLTDGGDSDYIVSEETKQLLRETHLGKKHSEETKKKMRESHKGKNNSMYGKQHSEESKEKNRQSHLGKPSGIKGKFLTKEHKEKIKKSKLGKKQTKEHIQNHAKSCQKPIIAYKDDNYIGVFESVNMAGKKLNVNRCNISKVLNGSLNFAGGYTFIYNN